jgi:hypothetical protein
LYNDFMASINPSNTSTVISKGSSLENLCSIIPSLLNEIVQKSNSMDSIIVVNILYI